MKRNYLLTAGIILTMLEIFGCATLKQIANIQKPAVDIQNVRITGLNFEAVSLAFDLKIANPNPLSVSISGFDYDFQIEDASFLKGKQAQTTTLKAMGESVMEIPVSLNFKDLYSTFQDLKDKDSTRYQMLCGVSVDLPIIGATRIPISKIGTLPNLKLPAVTVSSLKLNSISVSSADMELRLKVKNANAFSFMLNHLNYNFSVNGTKWASGLLDKQVRVPEKGETTIAIPVSLNFIEMGSSIYKIVTGAQKLNYELRAGVDLNSELPGLSGVKLPIDKSGEINISK